MTGKPRSGGGGSRARGRPVSRIRTIKPDFFRDEDLARLPFEVRLFYAGLFCQADKEGRLEDRPERLKVEIMPYDTGFNAEAALQTLAQPKRPGGPPFILRYEVGGEKLIQIRTWTKHQRPHNTERESAFPPPPPSGNGREGKGREGKGAGTLANRSETVKQRLANGSPGNPPPRPFLTISKKTIEAWTLAGKEDRVKEMLASGRYTVVD